MKKVENIKIQSCRIFCGLGISRQAYSKWLQSRVKYHLQSNLVKEMIQDKRKKHPKIGCRKLHFTLKDDLDLLGFKVGRDKFFSIAKEHSLLVKRKKKHCYTTDSNHPFKRYRDLYNQIEPTSPNQAWVSDITYIRMKNSFMYLSLITDAYSRKIIGYDLSNSLSVDGSLRALKMALKQKPKNNNLIHHSDRGVQYCSGEYTSLLKNHGIKISMTQSGSPYDNAKAERVNGILKDEYNLDFTFNDSMSLRKTLTQAIHLYNNERPHLKLNYLTPTEIHDVEYDKNKFLAPKIKNKDTCNLPQPSAPQPVLPKNNIDLTCNLSINTFNY